MPDNTPKAKMPKLTKEERLAENLRANLRRRKQAMRKSKQNSQSKTET